MMDINDFLQQAVRLHQAGKLREAEEHYRRILQAQPDQPDANHNLGVIAMQTGQPALGLSYLQNAWQLDANREQFCVTLTDCLLNMDRANDALRILKNATQRKGFSSPGARRLLHLATSIVTGDRPSIAIEQEILRLFHAGHHAAVEARLRSLLSQHLKWAAGWDLLCTTLQIQGKDAESALEHVCQLETGNVDRSSKQGKIFCIGANKTGTTSVENVIRSQGLIVGNQVQAEMLIHDWSRQDYRRIIRYCQSADAFQDLPFSLHGTYKMLDEAFPGSKFILTVRNSADEWFESLLRFHSKIVGKGRTPTADDLRQFNYRYPGFILDMLQMSYGAENGTLYDRATYIKYYVNHNNSIRTHFKERPGDLLELNVEDPDAMARLLPFLGYPYSGQKMPHLNISKD